MNRSHAKMSSTTRFVLTMGAIYGLLSLGCVLDPDPEPNNGQNNPNENNPNENNPNENNPDNNGGGCDQVVDSSFEFGEDTTLCGDVTVKTNIRLSDSQKLTISEGSTITMCVDCKIDIGVFSSQATLTAVGTADKPITFKGETSDAGSWDGIYIKDTAASNSTLEHVTIEDAGSDEAALNLDRSITLKHVTIRNSDSSGIQAEAFEDDSEDINIDTVASWALVLTGADAITNLPVDGDLTKDIGRGGIQVIWGSADGDQVRFKDAGLPYFIDSNIRLDGEESVTLDAGVVFKMGVDKYIEVGAFSNLATLKVEGTPEAPVVIEGAEADAGFWDGIYFNGSVASSSSIENLIVRHGGGNDSACVVLDKDITVKGLEIELCETAGFEIGDDGLAVDSTGIRVSGVEGPAGVTTWNGALNIPKGGDLTGNERDEVEISGGSVSSSGTLPALGVPYSTNSNWRISEDVEISVEPGVEIKFGPDNYIEVGAFGSAPTFIAEGADNEPIVFTGKDPSAGSWGGVFLNRNVTSNTKLDYVQIRYGGKTDEANLHILGVAEVTNCVLSNSGGHGIIIESSSEITEDLEAANTFSGNAQSNVLDERG